MPQLLSKAHQAALQKAQGYAVDAIPHISLLDEVASVFPHIKERVDDLKTRQRFLYDAATTALEAHRRLSTP